MSDGSPQVPPVGLAPSPGRFAHYLHPGQLFASGEAYQVTTILGTCVAVCVWDARASVGGLNHYLLSQRTQGGERSGRFGTVAFELLLEQVQQLGAVKSRLQAKVFGGMSSMLGRSAGRDLGQGNVTLALELLDAARIPVVSKDTGGPRGRKLIFQVDDGAAWVKLL